MDLITVLLLVTLIATLIRGFVESYYERKAVMLKEKELKMKEEDRAPWDDRT